jgi:DNA-binding response OmpR family regulator
MRATLCIVEDDKNLLHSITAIFEQAHYQVIPWTSASDAIAFLQSQPAIDLVLSDIVLGDGDGVTIAQIARQLPRPVEVILLTGYGNLQSAISALRVGVADYLLKPCPPQVLLTTVEQVLERQRRVQEREQFVEVVIQAAQRLQARGINNSDRLPQTIITTPPAGPPETRFLTINSLRFDRFTHRVALYGQDLHLTPTEYNLLLSLAEMQGQVLTYRDLVERAYGYAVENESARILLKSHIHNLRLKLPSAWLKSVRGVGYLLVPPETVAEINSF